MNHQRPELEVLSSFPKDRFSRMLPNQKDAARIIASESGSVTLEMPTGSGKTAVGVMFLRTAQKQGAAPLFYITPTKTLVEQAHLQHPELKVAYGRGEHACLYYPNENLKANEIPCLLLTDCAHRVNQETGETHMPGVAPCPYYQQKYEAKQGGIVACTMSFYLFTQLFSREWERPAALVIDEAHRLASVVRSSLSYEITDYHLRRLIELLDSIGAREAVAIRTFLRTMLRIIKKKPVSQRNILATTEIEELMGVLADINPDEMREKIGTVVRKQVDPVEHREVLKQLETLVYDLRRYLDSLAYSLTTPDRNPLNYVYSYYTEEEEGSRDKVRYRLFIKSYYVAPVIKRILSRRTLAYSATIGDPQVFGFETGIKAPFHSLPSDFPVENTRIFMPTDTPNLATKERSRREPTRVLRTIAKACHTFARAGHRSLVVVVSEAERKKFLMLCEEERVRAISYGDGVRARDAAQQFREGVGQYDVLVGTAANYGEGVDLPKQLAPVIFFLRPGYPSPSDPATIFEERRFGNMRWKLWNWRVMMEAQQVRGRNIRGAQDLGVTFFISQQFRRFLFGGLPQWLQESYRGTSTFEECVAEAKKLLQCK